VIFHPQPGQHVRIHYNRRSAAAMPHHGRTGVVRIAGRGPGPRNVGVEIGGQIVVVPRGNLVAVEPGRRERFGGGGQADENTPASRAGAVGEGEMVVPSVVGAVCGAEDRACASGARRASASHPVSGVSTWRYLWYA